jgi:uncharacterized membrane protein YphA (DoxX/SURF4 family)
MSGKASLLRRLDQTGLPLLIARLALGGLFIYMGLEKALNPIDFLKMVREYHMVPEHPPIFLNLIAAVLPWLEVWCGLLLVAGVALRGTALLLLAMLVAFTAAVTLRALNIYHAGHLPFCAIKFNCGCGTGEEWICHKIPKNLGLCLLSLLILLSRSGWLCLSRDLAKRERI